MPTDCTAVLNTKSSSSMYSRSRHEASNTMTRKTKQSASPAAKVKALEVRLNKLAMQRPKKAKTKATPFGTTGSIIGKSIGGMFGNASIGTGIGKWLGTGIGSIFGSGDYQQMGNSPNYNVISNGSQVPQFSTTRQKNVVCHREYLGDILGTAGFNNTAYPLNPGMAQTFPWLSSVASNYQEYKFHGLVFEFRSLITDFVTSGAPGVVVMSTNYNADVAVYTTKQQMENAEYAVSVKPTINLMHGIECALGQTILPEKFIRTGAVPANQDLRLYDLGIFQFATQSNPVQDLGELWVTYCVEFFKPQLPPDVGGDTSSQHVYRTTVTTANPLGLIQTVNSGGLGATVTPTLISWIAAPSQKYFISFEWNATGSAIPIAYPALAFAGLSALPFMQNDSTPFNFTPGGGSTATSMAVSFVALCSLTNPGLVSITLSGSGAFPLGSSVDIIVTEFDNAVIA
jgi:uncharacterized protein YcfJ